MFKKSKKVIIEPELAKEAVTTKNFKCLQYNGSNHEQIVDFYNRYSENLGKDKFTCVVLDNFIILYIGDGSAPRTIKKGHWVYFNEYNPYIAQNYENIM